MVSYHQLQKVYPQGCSLLTWPNLIDKNILFILYTKTIDQSLRIKGYSKDNLCRWEKCVSPQGISENSLSKTKTQI